MADTLNHRVQKFAADGKFAGWIGGKVDGSVTGGAWAVSGEARSGSERGALKSPIDVKLVDGQLFVADEGNGRVQIIDLADSVQPHPTTPQ